MADDASPSTMPEELRDLIARSLRQEHPWMKTNAVHAAAKAHMELLATQIESSKSFRNSKRLISVTDGCRCEDIKASKARCSFMSLPPELRTWIYELVLLPEETGDGDVSATTAIAVDTRGMSSSSYSGRAWPPRRETTWAQQPALTRTSRAVRAESLPVYYGRNHFVAYSKWLVKWVSDSPKYRVEVEISATEAWLACTGPANKALVNSLEICHNFSMDRTVPEWTQFVEGWSELADTLATTLPKFTKHLCLQKDYDMG